MPRPPPRSTLFPYTTLFRSSATRATPAASSPTLLPRALAGGETIVCDKGYAGRDRKSTRLNSSHQIISYAVFCLKKKKKKKEHKTKLPIINHLVYNLQVAKD